MQIDFNQQMCLIQQPPKKGKNIMSKKQSLGFVSSALLRTPLHQKKKESLFNAITNLSFCVSCKDQEICTYVCWTQQTQQL